MIDGERIRLRQIERADLPTFVAWLNDPEIRRNLAGYWPMSLAREERWFEEQAKRPVQEQPLVIEARHGEGWKVIGNCGFHGLDWRERNAELGIMIGAKEEWNKGYATEAMQLLLRVGFETLNMHRLYLRVYERNAAAIRAYEKAGFVPEGRQRQANYDEGVYSDVLMMSVLRPEWEARKGGAQ